MHIDRQTRVVSTDKVEANASESVIERERERETITRLKCAWGREIAKFANYVQEKLWGKCNSCVSY